MSPQNYIAGNNRCNCSITAARQFIAGLAAEGVTAALFACPNGVAGEIDQMLPQAQFAANGLVGFQGFDLYVTATGFPDSYNVAEALLFMVTYGWTAKQCLV